MNEFYVEQLMKKRTTASERAIKLGLLVLTAASFGLMMWAQFAIVVPVILMIIDIQIFRALDIEYEYLYIDGELQIDKITNKNRRKKLLEISIDEIEIIAPSGHEELFMYKDLRFLDYSSKNAEDKIYEAIILSGEEPKRLVLELHAALLDGMSKTMPDKIIRDVR